MTRIWLALLLLIPLAATAQDAATLVADRVFIDVNNTLIAEGNVAIFQGDNELNAERITYDATTQLLQIEGPLRLKDGDAIVIVADQAALSRDLQNGIMLGARMVLNQQLQLAAVEISRIDGRFTQAYKVAATSCNVCAGKAPIWQIRARRIIHDTQEQQLYFDHAQLLVLDVPIFYLPRLRMPDPSLKRATGFLLPRLSSSTQLGFGLRMPYFVRLGDRADITVTPFISDETRAVELAYRRTFTKGDISIDANISQDTLVPGATRWSVFADGSFDVPRDFKLSFDLETTSDDAYLLDYGYSDVDRLDSAISLDRTKRDEDIGARLTSYYTLRESEENATQPTIVTDYDYTRRYFPTRLGGEVTLNFDFHNHYRSSDSTVDSDGDGLSDGLDMTRLSASGAWQRDWVTHAGLVFGAETQLDVDYYFIDQDPNFSEEISNVTPSAAISMALPLVKSNADTGITHILEPKLQLTWSKDSGDDVPNEDSTRVEFDEGNLFSLSRAPGFDAAERGLRANIGLTWTRIGTSGRSSSLTVGRIFRFSGDSLYSETSGLDDKNSDWLISAGLELPNAIDLLSRTTFDFDTGFSKNETRLDWTKGQHTFGASYIYLVADADEDRAIDVSELTMRAAYQITPTVRGDLDWRYDLASKTTASAKLGLVYINECVEVALSASRRFTSSSTIDPSTDFGFSIGLRGFGTGGSASPHRRTCDDKQG